LISCELDSHADTCCFGHDALLLYEDLSKHAQVTPFMPSLGTATNVPIALVAVAYDCPRTYSTYILIFHQVLYMQDLPHALRNPNQLRLNGLTVNDIPLSFLTPSNWHADCNSFLKRDLCILLNTIIPDNAMEMVEGEFKRMALRAGSAIKPVEVYTHNQNLAESAIRDLCHMFQKAKRTTNALYVLWITVGS
jgi:hypothetical protein